MKNGIKKCIVVMVRLTQSTTETIAVQSKKSEGNERVISLKQSKFNIKRNEHKTVEKLPSEDTPSWSGLIAQNRIIDINDIVCARMTGHKPWPARIIRLYCKSNRMYAWVKFFGTFQVGEVYLNQCVPFVSCAELLLHICNGSYPKFNMLTDLSEKRTDFLKTTSKQQQYLQAIRDAEICVGMPESLSMLQFITFIE